MSLYDYEQSKEIAAHDYQFYALIMAAIRQADTDNLLKLELAFPRQAAELRRRYDMPGGLLPEDSAPTPLPVLKRINFDEDEDRGGYDPR